MTQPLSLSKQHLVFELHGNSRKSQTSLEVRNIENTRQLYKIMTTGRKRYIVKPSAGVLEPFASAKVEIFLMLTDEDRDPEVLKDKFCVFTLPAGDQTWEKKAMDQYIADHRKEVQHIYFTVSVAQKDKQNFLNTSQPGSEGVDEEKMDVNLAPPNPSVMDSARSVSLPGDFGYPETTVKKVIPDQRNSLSSKLEAERTLPVSPSIGGFEQASVKSKEEEQKSKSKSTDQKLMGFNETDNTSSVNIRLKQRVVQLEGELKILKVIWLGFWSSHYEGRKRERKDVPTLANCSDRDHWRYCWGFYQLEELISDNHKLAVLNLKEFL